MVQAMAGETVDTGAAGSPDMFRGPSAYVPNTPWSPLAGFAASIAVFLGAVLAVALVLIVSKSTSGDEVLTNVLGTLVQQVAMIGLTVFAAARYGARPSDVLALRAPAQGRKAYVVAFLMLVALTVVMNVVVQTIDTDQSFKGDIKIYDAMFKSGWWWLTLIVVGIGAPLSEELLCRGLMFSALAKSRLGNWGAAVLTSLAFAIVHPYSLAGVLQVFTIGMLFSWMLIRTGSLRVTMACHALYNSVMAVMLLTGSVP